LRNSLRAGSVLLATVIALTAAPAALAQEATTEPTTTTTDSSTTTDSTTTTDSAPTTTEAEPDPWAETAKTRRLKRRALHFRHVARRLCRLMQRERPHVNRERSDFRSLLAYRRWLRNAWRNRADRARYRAHHPPHLDEWLCIHRYEGPWKDPNPTYYGGLQMDLAFQSRYGPRLLRRKGTADHWAPYEQMWIAERALRDGRGFYPWPLTARRCGLI
jgi:hypothetical protein